MIAIWIPLTTALTTFIRGCQMSTSYSKVDGTLLHTSANTGTLGTMGAGTNRGGPQPSPGERVHTSDSSQMERHQTPGSTYSMYSSMSRRSTATVSNQSIRRVVGADSQSVNNSDEDHDTIRVVVRLRPMNTAESLRNDGQALFVLEDGQTIQVQGPDAKSQKPMTFHRVYGESSSQDVVFENCGVKLLIDRALEGYNTTVFAFGQTGSGKTFTITGPDDIEFSPNDSSRWGIVPRSLNYLFQQTAQRRASGECSYTIRGSYLEIYNEQVQDLLNPTNTSLPVRWTQDKGFYVENLFVVQCEVLDDCMAVLEEGLRNRKTGATALNEHSSRSHGLMTIYIDCETVDPDDQRVYHKKGKICFVDLAGSEKVKESKATGDTLTEALNINKSLLTLGNCISALADMKKKSRMGGPLSANASVHVPYRDSKLTKLLSDTLGGNGLALMIANVTPSTYNLGESLKTLRYASRAKHIQNRPVIQMDPREELIMKLKKELKAVRAENDSLRALLLDTSSGRPLSQADAQLIYNKIASISTPSSRLPSAHAPAASAQLPPINPTSNNSSSKDVNNELLHTKQMLSKFIEESKELKNQNAELTLEKHRFGRENKELMLENDRLIAKIENLVEIFGSNLDGDKVHHSSAKESVDSDVKNSNLQEMSKLYSSTRLLLMAKRANSNPNLVLDEQQPHESLKNQTMNGDQMKDLSKKNGIDRSFAELNANNSNVASPSPLPVPSSASKAMTSESRAKNGAKNQLKQDLDRLDEEINSLKNNKK